MDWNSKALSTRCIHADEMDDAFGSPRTPLYTTTTFKFPSTAELLDVIEGRKPGNLYTRYGMNPTVTAAEAKLACLEGSDTALMFGAGMAAISALFLAHGRCGIACVGNMYGGTLELLLEQLPPLGIAIHWVLSVERDRLPALLQSGVRLVYCETPANPTLDITDLAELAQLAHRYGAVLAVDNTFASPVNQQPLALAPSLGGIESLVSQPAATSRHGQTAAKLARQGITESMLRLSVGLEDPADLLADLEQALS